MSDVATERLPLEGRHIALGVTGSISAYKAADLASKLRVAYVSIDDDERLSKRFLNEQPKTGVRQSYFLKNQTTRKEWLEALGFSDVPKLPLHVLLDPTGVVSCVIEGAIDANDFAQVEALVSK